MGAVDSTLTKPEPARCRSTAAEENTIRLPHLLRLVTPSRQRRYALRLDARSEGGAGGTQ